jgi:hypothetical protein
VVDSREECANPLDPMRHHSEPVLYVYQMDESDSQIDEEKSERDREARVIRHKIM